MRDAREASDSDRRGLHLGDPEGSIAAFRRDENQAPATDLSPDAIDARRREQRNQESVARGEAREQLRTRATVLGALVALATLVLVELDTAQAIEWVIEHFAL